MYKGCIYSVINLINGNVYIGQTVRPIKVRWQEHIRDAKKGKSLLSDAITKFGENNFAITPMEIISCATETERHKKLNDLERKYIKKYQTTGKNGYNIACGGSGPQWLARSSENAVDVYLCNGNFLATFISGREAGRVLNIPDSNISRVCHGKRKQSGGYIFRFHGDAFNKFTLPDF